MIALILLLLMVAVIVAASVRLDHLVSVKEQARIEQEVNRAHLHALQSAQRIHSLTWRARQALFDEAKRSGNGQ